MSDQVIANITWLLGALDQGRAAMYQSGSPVTLTMRSLREIDQARNDLRTALDALCKLRDVEKEAIAFDIAMRTADNGQPRAPDGRDYHELFAILSPAPAREKA